MPSEGIGGRLAGGSCAQTKSTVHVRFVMQEDWPCARRRPSAVSWPQRQHQGGRLLAAHQRRRHVLEHAGRGGVGAAAEGDRGLQPAAGLEVAVRQRHAHDDLRVVELGRERADGAAVEHGRRVGCADDGAQPGAAGQRARRRDALCVLSRQQSVCAAPHVTPGTCGEEHGLTLTVPRGASGGPICTLVPCGVLSAEKSRLPKEQPPCCASAPVPHHARAAAAAAAPGVRAWRRLPRILEP